MKNKNQQIVDQYFAAYARHDMDAIRKVMDESITWHFPGQHPLAGVKKGVDEVVAFFDSVGKIMMESKPSIEKLIVAENDDYLIECIHSKTNRNDEHNLEHYACVLWRFRDGRIVEGRHFFADPEAINNYFTALAKK